MNAASFTFLALGLAIVAGAAGLHLRVAGKKWPAWPAGLLACLAFGLAAGLVQPMGVWWVMLLCLAGWWHGRSQGLLSGGCFGALALAMALHVLPGFRHLPLMVNVVLAPGALPFNLSAHVDKGLAGLCLWMLMGRTAGCDRRAHAGPCDAALVGQVLAWALGTATIVMGLAWAVGLVHVAPRWLTVPDAWALVWRFMLVNLFLTCVAEEAFFRGLVQGGLARWMSARPAWKRHAVWGAVAVAAVLFGLAHVGGGWLFAALATLAGLGYGLACARTGRLGAAVTVHFTVNAVHFLFFTYPRLA
ncbi:MAG: CPBP family intramembrane metalloprotease [Aquabacterium sp.]